MSTKRHTRSSGSKSKNSSLENLPHVGQPERDQSDVGVQSPNSALPESVQSPTARSGDEKYQDQFLGKTDNDGPNSSDDSGNSSISPSSKGCREESQKSLSCFSVDFLLSHESCKRKSHSLSPVSEEDNVSEQVNGTENQLFGVFQVGNQEYPETGYCVDTEMEEPAENDDNIEMPPAPQMLGDHSKITHNFDSSDGFNDHLIFEKPDKNRSRSIYHSEELSPEKLVSSKDNYFDKTSKIEIIRDQNIDTEELSGASCTSTNFDNDNSTQCKGRASYPDDSENKNDDTEDCSGVSSNTDHSNDIISILHQGRASIQNGNGNKLNESSLSSSDTPNKSKGVKRKLKRTQYSKDDLLKLNSKFQENPWLSPEKQEKLAADMGYTDNQIKTWFQNKRASIYGSRKPKKRPLQEFLHNHLPHPQIPFRPSSQMQNGFCQSSQMFTPTEKEQALTSSSTHLSGAQVQASVETSLAGLKGRQPNSGSKSLGLSSNGYPSYFSSSPTPRFQVPQNQNLTNSVNFYRNLVRHNGLKDPTLLLPPRKTHDLANNSENYHPNIFRPYSLAEPKVFADSFTEPQVNKENKWTAIGCYANPNNTNSHGFGDQPLHGVMPTSNKIFDDQSILSGFDNRHTLSAPSPNSSGAVINTYSPPSTSLPFPVVPYPRVWGTDSPAVIQINDKTFPSFERDQYRRHIFPMNLNADFLNRTYPHASQAPMDLSLKTSDEANSSNSEQVPFCNFMEDFKKRLHQTASAVQNTQQIKMELHNEDHYQDKDLTDRVTSSQDHVDKSE